MVRQRIVEVLIHKQQEALDCGNPPFAAVIECDGEILASAANDSRTTGNPLRHAEMLAIESVIKKNSPAFLLKSHLYASNEPCPMCIGACIWSGVHNVTYFLSQEHVAEIRGWGRFISAKVIASADDSGICVNGPIMNEEMLRMHKRFWSTDGNSKQKHSIHLSH
ncbi:MAG: nucleoside deaminase [Desulfobacteraceae bacterium]|nr:nucleoside deaminase [Desulfobacteraceae bacterium]MBU4001339.1 nucleoside deaminase [Pseudomonadota bacterium]